MGSDAFTVSTDQKHLMLRAEKSKLDTAMGIERDNWPSVTNPNWGAEPFWENDPGKLDKVPDVTPKPGTKPEIK